MDAQQSIQTPSMVPSSPSDMPKEKKAFSLRLSGKAAEASLQRPGWSKLIY